MWLRKTVRDMADGIRSAVDVLLWGSAYPRTITIRDLGQLQSRTIPSTPAASYRAGTDMSRLPMQPMPMTLSVPPRRELTPEESVRWGLAYIRSQYGHVTQNSR